MKTKYATLVICSVVLCMLVSGCGLGQSVSPTLTTTPTITATPTRLPTPTRTATEAPLPTVTPKAGLSEDFHYNSPNGNFSCNFSYLMEVDGLNPYFQDESNPNYGSAWVNNDFGLEYAVDYVRTSFLSNEMETLLNDPATRQEGLEKFFIEILMASRLQHFPGSEMKHKEFISEDVLFVVLDVPQRSNLVDQNSKRLDSQEADYVLTIGGWVYIVSFYRTPEGGFPVFEPSEMQDQLEDFYKGCDFEP